MASPMTDAKPLAELVYAAWRVRDMVRGVDWYVEAATAVRDACIPPDTHVVVPRAEPKAELEALLSALADMRDWCDQTPTKCGWTYEGVMAAFRAYQAALGKESTK